MTFKDMEKFLFVFGVGLRLVSGLAYGDYPPPEKILAHLVGNEGNGGARFKRLFCEIREEAKEGIFGQGDPRKLVGEERGPFPEKREANILPMTRDAGCGGISLTAIF